MCTRIVSNSDIVEGFRCHYIHMIQQWIDESERRPAGPEAALVELGEHGGPHWRGGRGAALQRRLGAHGDVEEGPERGHVRVPATPGAEEARGGQAPQRVGPFQVLWHVMMLPPRAGVDVREAAAGGDDVALVALGCYLAAEAALEGGGAGPPGRAAGGQRAVRERGGAHRQHVGAGGGPARARAVRAELQAAADAVVARGEDQGRATEAQLEELLVHSLQELVLPRVAVPIALVAAVADRVHHLRGAAGGRQLEQPLEELLGAAEGRAVGRGVVPQLQARQQRGQVFHVQLGLAPGLRRVVPAIARHPGWRRGPRPCGP
mmetsp:Transcript_2801/g.5225  ORF Transcript_2801/g.5225 Transcript_2801/m.5225 type:complete len:320 (-) Transcript_2801:176-1135(-)